jgi:hypothetical protein
MIRRLIRARLDREERRLGASLDYIRFILDRSLRLFLRFAKLLGMADCRKAAPPDVFHTACLLATMREDCGTCLQVGVNLARREGLSPTLVSAILDGRLDDLPEGLRDVHRFTCAVLDRSAEAEALRERVRDRFGDEALIELALGIAAARAFPTIKWTLGYATSCSAVPLDLSGGARRTT